ncbi:MAG: Synechococcus phage, partial [Bacteroidota bacterium]
AAAALLLKAKPIKEDSSYEEVEKYIEENFNEIYNKLLKLEDVTAGSGDIAGIGQPPGSIKGEPGIPVKMQKKYRKINALKALKEETTLQYHNQLNPKLWDSMNMLKDDVRGKLLQIADTWVAFAKIPPILIYDIVITGGNVNYNYTPSSDIDLHIVMSRAAINPDRVLVDEYLQDKKILWSLQHPDISIYGFPVELYAQDIDEQPHTNQGVYSVTQNRWIARPQHLDIDFENDYHLQKKVKFYMDMIDKMIEDKANDDSIDILKDKIKKMRGDSIAKEGEFAFGNLIFKELRNAGYIDKLNDYKRTSQDKFLSLGRP